MSRISNGGTTPAPGVIFWDGVGYYGGAALEGLEEGATNVVSGARDTVVELVHTGSDLMTYYSTNENELNLTTFHSRLFQGAIATADNPDAAASFDRQLLFGLTTMGMGPMAVSGYNAVVTGDSTEFSQQAGGFGVMVLVPYAGGKGWAYFRGPRFAVDPPPASTIPELPPTLLRMPNSPQGALPPVEIPPELLPVTDSLFYTLYNEVTANPPPVRRLQVLEAVQCGADGSPSTAVSGRPAVVDIPGINTTPLSNAPTGTPPPGVCGVPRALGGAVEATGVLPEGPISTVSGGFRLRNVPGGGPKELRLVSNCEECANLMGQNPGRLTPTGFPPDAVLTVINRPIELFGSVEIPVGGRIVINRSGQPTFNGQPIELPTNVEFGFTPPLRWADGLTLGIPAPHATITLLPLPPVDGGLAATGTAFQGSLGITK